MSQHNFNREGSRPQKMYYYNGTSTLSFLLTPYTQTFYFEIQQKCDKILTSYDSKVRLFVFYTKI